MCELLAMSSREPTRLNFSLSALAAHGAPEGRAHDGWGAAFFEQNDVALFREPRAAGSSPLVNFLEVDGPECTLALSHIRRATRGAVALRNTQPFSRIVGGRAHAFAHNGDLPGIAEALPLQRSRPVGDTDSEHAFCALLETMASLWEGDAPTLAERLERLAEFAARLRTLGPANFLYCDGELLFVHGHRRWNPARGRIEPPGLHLLTRHCGDRDERVQGHGLTVGAGFQQVTLVASLPLSEHAWRPLEEGELVAIGQGRELASLSA